MYNEITTVQKVYSENHERGLYQKLTAVTQCSLYTVAAVLSKFLRAETSPIVSEAVWDRARFKRVPVRIRCRSLSLSLIIRICEKGGKFRCVIKFAFPLLPRRCLICCSWTRPIARCEISYHQLDVSFIWIILIHDLQHGVSRSA